MHYLVQQVQLILQQQARSQERLSLEGLGLVVTRIHIHSRIAEHLAVDDNENLLHARRFTDVRLIRNGVLACP